MYVYMMGVYKCPLPGYLLTLQGFTSQMNPGGSSYQGVGEAVPQALPGSLLPAEDILHWERCDQVSERVTGV